MNSRLSAEIYVWNRSQENLRVPLSTLQLRNATNGETQNPAGSVSYNLKMASGTQSFAKSTTMSLDVALSANDAVDVEFQSAASAGELQVRFVVEDSHNQQYEVIVPCRL
jgi:hypothetical protein